MGRFLITTLAEYQTEFWREVGLEARRLGHEAAFLSFDDRSTEMLRAAGLEVFPATKAERDADDARSNAEVIRDAGIADPQFWYRHERHAFGIADEALLEAKLVQAIRAAERAVDRFAQGGSFAMVQELGGFLSVVGSDFVARTRGIDCWFIEPSFFRGRLLFLDEGFGALRLPDGARGEPGAEMRAYVEDTLSQGKIVIPAKDSHQYRDAWSKVVNAKNARRLIEKTADKYLRGKRQEFGYIGHHVRQHLMMIVNSRRLRRHYTPIEALGRFVYYPLHVPGDMALTLRSPEYLDQVALIDRLCALLPEGATLAIKEHPAMIGALDSTRLIALKRRHANLAILPPDTNNYRVLSRAGVVVTVNSKSGAEAGLVGTPVVVLGDAFYRNAPFAHAVDELAELPGFLDKLLSGALEETKKDEMLAYFAALWARTYPGELYVSSPENVGRFTHSLAEATTKGGRSTGARACA